MPAFRFGYQHPRASDADALREAARRAEAGGFDVFHTGDHVLADVWPPLLGLAVVAQATTRLRVGPLVLNNDLRHPVVLAGEVAALDRLSGGRVELGLGAGHSFTEYAAMGLAFDPPPERKARLAEAVEVLRRLLDGEQVDHTGEHYQLSGVRTMAPAQDRVPILVGVNGAAALAHAARHADTVSLTMMGRTLPDGQSHEARWEADRLDRAVALIGRAADGRARPLELHALVQAVVVTDDRRRAAEAVVVEVPTLSVDDALTTPFLALGTHDEIADHLRTCRDRWGISYFSVRSIDAFTPVIDRLRKGDSS